MSPDLPGALRAALDRELDGVSRNDLAARAQKTSLAYRQGGTSAATILGPQDALAYALARLPATYAACAAVFEAAQAAAPAFQPLRLLDAGVGPGAASWAAVEAWPGLADIAWLDASTPFLELARRLARETPVLDGAQAQRIDLTSDATWPKADLVTASYALAEIAPDRQAGVVASLWDACEGVLALVEPGTPAGFARILAARDVVMAAGGHVLAPCAHQKACPLVGPDWCHFSQRLPRSRDHQLAKRAAVPFEDEKFAYLLAARPHVVAARAAARVLAPPRAGKPGIDLKLCTPAGLEHRFVPRRDKPAHAVARRLSWGDRLPDA